MRLLTVVFSLYCFNVLGQVAEGWVVNRSTQQRVPYVSIYLKKNSSLGTISNNEGSFTLRVTDTPGDSIIFTHVGFKRKAVSVEEFSVFRVQKIFLDEQPKMLKEVIVMPDSNLLTLLRRAYLKIETNFANEGTLYEGFYRETNQVDETRKFVYFAESVIQFYKPGYGNKRFGPVKIIKGGKSEVESRGEYSNIYFYAGVYCPQRFDFVKERYEFIDPKHFGTYRYSLEGIINTGDNEVYEISFAPRSSTSKALYKGKFYIDTRSLAYTSLSCDYTEAGIRHRNSQRLNSIDYTSSHFETRYRELDGRWYLNFLAFDGKLYNPKYKTHLRYTCEYVTTSVEPARENPIKESDAIPFTAIYTQQDAKFSEGYWNDNETIARNSELQEHVSLLFTKNDLGIDPDSSKHITVGRKPTGIPKIARVAMRMGSSYGIGVMPIKITPGEWRVDYGSNVNATQTVGSKPYAWIMDYELSFKLNRSFGVALRIIPGMSKEQIISSSNIGFYYTKLLTGWRRPLSLQLGAEISFMGVYQKVGSQNPATAFSINETSFKANRNVDIYVGQRSTGVMPYVQVSYGFKPFLHLFVATGFYRSLEVYDELKVSQKNSWLTKKATSVDLNESGLTVDGVASVKSPITIPDYALFMRVGIKMGL